MNLHDTLIALFLIVGVVVALIGCLGVWLMPGAYARLHYVGLLSTLAAFSLGAAVVIEEGFTVATSKTVLIVLTVAVSGPIAGHATARAGWIRARGRWEIPAADPPPEAGEAQPPPMQEG